MGGTRRLSAADAAWLRMDGPDNRMIITGLLTLGRPLGLEQIRAVISERLLRFAPFTRRVVRRGLLRSARWVPDPSFDVATHVRPVQLVPPGDPEVLRQLVDQMMAQPLDPAHPPWLILVVEGYGEGTVLLVRLHHCIADGMALLRVLLSLGDPGPNSLPRAAPPPPHRALAARLAHAAVLVPRSLAALLQLLLLPKDHGSAIKGRLSGDKKSAWSRPLPLEELRAVAHRYGATVNDLLTAALAGALRAELLPGPVPKGVRAIVPVDLRPGRLPGELGNFFGMVFLTLPVNLSEPAARLAAVRRRMGRLKRSEQALVALQIVRLVGGFSSTLARLIIWMFGRKGTLVLTNVPGPRREMRLAGAPITNLTFWVPQSAGLGVGVSLLSYAGRARVAIAADAALLPEPRRVIERLERELERLGHEPAPAPLPGPATRPAWPAPPVEPAAAG